MPVFTNIRQHFARPAAPAKMLLPEAAAQALSHPIEATPERLPTLSDVNERPAWLDDEDILRDEGVFFGLSNARPDELISLIRHEFARQTAPLEQAIDQHNEKIGDLNLFIEQHENHIGELQYKLDELATYKPLPHQLPRTLAGLSLSVLMCIGTFFLIDETLRPAFAESRWIAIGVFLAGMFSLFNRTSLFHETDSPTTPRRLLEEMGLPLAASIFVFVQALKTQSVGPALALLLFVFFLFLLAGKLLLGNLTVLWNDLHAVGQNRRFTRDQLANTTKWESGISQLRQEIDRFRVQKWQIIPDLNRNQAALSRLNARRDGLIKLFESEFNLARSLRDRLTPAQRQAIISR